MCLTHVGQPSNCGSTGRVKIAASGNLSKTFRRSLHFFALIGVACTTGSFLDFDGVGGVVGETTSFSFPLMDIRGMSAVEGRETLGSDVLSFLILCEGGTVFGVGVRTTILSFATADEEPVGVGFSFFAGVANASMSSSSVRISVFFRFPGTPFRVSFSLSFSDVERRRCSFSSSFSRSIASTS